jgi:hypothetical protein
MGDLQRAEDRKTRVDHVVASLASFFKQSGDCIVWIGSGLSIGCGYRLGMDIQAQKSYLFLHDRLLSACGSGLWFLPESQPNPRPAQWTGHSILTSVSYSFCVVGKQEVTLGATGPGVQLLVQAKRRFWVTSSYRSKRESLGLKALQIRSTSEG